MKLKRQLLIQCKYKTGPLLTPETGNIFFLSYVQIINLGVKKFHFSLSSPSC